MEATEKFLSDMALADMASKVHLLQSLSSFLSCLATPTSYSTEDYSISASVGASRVCLQHIEVSRLHELLFQELKNRTCFLSAPFRTNNDEEWDESDDGIVSRTLHLEILSQTLRCCIRILPLLDLFDKFVSRTSAKMLDGIVQQLCSPARLVNLLGLTAVWPGRCFPCNSSHSAQDTEDGAWFEITEPHSGKEFFDNLRFPSKPHDGCEANLPAAKHSENLMEAMLAILEVYMDELLLRPDLCSRLMSSRDDMHRSTAKEQAASCDRDQEAPLEAAFVHALLSLHSQSTSQASHVVGKKDCVACNLSLPAGLILLEKFKREQVPPFYVAHIVRLVARILNDTTPLSRDQVDALARSRHVEVAGGVDWSYCIQQRLPNCDAKNWRLNTNVLNSVDTLAFASSIFERALLLYMRFCVSAEQPFTSQDGKGSTASQALQGPVLRLFLSKYEALYHIFTKNLGLDFIDRRSHDLGVLQLNFVGDEEDTGKVSGLVAALLQLMSCALECIGREVFKLTWLPHSFGPQFFNGRALSTVEYNDDFDRILHCVSLNLRLCIPFGTSFSSKSDLLPAVDGKINSEPNQWVGQTIVFFTSILRGEVQRGAPDGLLKEYFHLLESLVALLLTVDKYNDRNSTTENGLSSCCLPSEDICRKYLESVVLALQGMHQDLSKQQRSMPQFLPLVFLKEISKDTSRSLNAGEKWWNESATVTVAWELGVGNLGVCCCCECQPIPDQTEPSAPRTPALVAQKLDGGAYEIGGNGSQQTPYKSEPSSPTNSASLADRLDVLVHEVGGNESQSIPNEIVPFFLTTPALVTQNLDVVLTEVGSNEPQQTPAKRKLCSPTTSAIIKRLFKSPPPVRKKAVKPSRSLQALLPSSINSYMDVVSAENPSKDSFDDLKDFIVPKKGRDYSAWLRRRRKFRRVSHNRNLFRRLEEKKDLVRALDIGDLLY